MSDSELKPEKFFDEHTKDIVVDPSSHNSDKTQVATPAKVTSSVSTSEQTVVSPPQAKTPVQTPAAGSTMATPASAQLKEALLSVQIPAKLPEVSERKAELPLLSDPPPQAPAPAASIPKTNPYPNSEPEVDNIEIDSHDFRPTGKRDSEFTSLPSGTQITNLLNKNFQSISIWIVGAAIIFVIIYVSKHRVSGDSYSSRQIQLASEYSWRMNLSRPWLPVGPDPKSWNDFQKSMDQAMTDLSSVEK